jgi:hypothetical protein
MADKKLVIERLLSSANKAQEIAWLDRLCHEGVANNTYMANLFSPGLLEWATERIRKDMDPNIWDLVLHLQREAQDLRDREREYESSLEDLRKETKEGKALLESHLRLDKITKEEASTRGAEVSSLQELLAHKDVEVLQLKAECYDLQKMVRK